ncbi:MAG TPA: hypothetical protein VM870_08010 [Pyrinomonadaceae bacterium]|jgi:type II secretory pathway pseudopilin PulG|nr:hypothetical protein [Pyrinomonadaceae bacterium]
MKKIKHRPDEEGYTLVVLLGLMAVLAVVMTGVAPNLRQQAQREREQEAIFRGEQIAQAIRGYIAVRGVPPTSMKQLLEGVPRGIKTVQILRPSAARDPLTAKGEWRTVAPTDPELVDFKQALTLYAGGSLPPPTDALTARFGNAVAAPVVAIGGAQTSVAQGSSSPFTGGSFLGVASKSGRASVINYYGIDRHDRWIFTPLFR